MQCFPPLFFQGRGRGCSLQLWSTGTALRSLTDKASAFPFLQGSSYRCSERGCSPATSSCTQVGNVGSKLHRGKRGAERREHRRRVPEVVPLEKAGSSRTGSRAACRQPSCRVTEFILSQPERKGCTQQQGFVTTDWYLSARPPEPQPLAGCMFSACLSSISCPLYRS